MGSRIPILSHIAVETTINNGSISASRRSVEQQLPSFLDGQYSRELQVASGRDESKVYKLALWKRRNGHPKETIGGWGLKRFINDHSLKVGDKIILFKEVGVSKLSNAVLTDDFFILDYEKC